MGPIEQRCFALRSHVQNNLEFAGADVESLITLTETGPIRNAICDANIHIKAAQEKMREAARLAALKGE